LRWKWKITTEEIQTMSYDEIRAKLSSQKKWLTVYILNTILGLFSFLVNFFLYRNNIGFTISLVFAIIFFICFVLLREQHSKLKQIIEKLQPSFSKLGQSGGQTKEEDDYVFFFPKFKSRSMFIVGFTFVFGLVFLGLFVYVILAGLGQLGVIPARNLFDILEYDQATSSNLFMLTVLFAYIIAFLLGVLIWKERTLVNRLYYRIKYR
jgi:hypothetical protein